MLHKQLARAGEVDRIATATITRPCMTHLLLLLWNDERSPRDSHEGCTQQYKGKAHSKGQTWLQYAQGACRVVLESLWCVNASTDGWHIASDVHGCPCRPNIATACVLRLLQMQWWGVQPCHKHHFNTTHALQDAHARCRVLLAWLTCCSCGMMEDAQARAMKVACRNTAAGRSAKIRHGCSAHRGINAGWCCGAQPHHMTLHGSPAAPVG